MSLTEECMKELWIQMVRMCSYGADRNSIGELTKCWTIMKFSHRGQVDKLGKPYWFHPARVAGKFNDFSNEQLTALLHDVVEDSDISLEDLRELKVPEVVIEAVSCITHGKHEEYISYLKRVKSNPVALAVKLKDIEDNLDPNRLLKLPEETRDRLKKKYEKALEYLNNQWLS